jgi:hypothetical protein
LKIAVRQPAPSAPELPRSTLAVVPDEIGRVPVIENHILFVRGQNVLLDADLAGLYEVSTGKLN